MPHIILSLHLIKRKGDLEGTFLPTNDQTARKMQNKRTQKIVKYERTD